MESPSPKTAKVQYLQIRDIGVLVTNISPSPGIFEDHFPFPVWWDMLVP